jgi:voltage-gated potassium channel
MHQFRHIAILTIGVSAVLITGTCGYMLIEGWPFMDAFYMTVITLATVGYGETRPLGQAGRLFTIILIFSGVGTFFYVAGLAMQFMVEGRIRQIMGRRRLDRSIAKRKGHTIVCGYGRIGRVLCRHLAADGLETVVIDRSETAIRALDEDGLLYVNGEATDEANLVKAGIERAAGLVAALGTDTDNVFLVLSARQMRPDLYIMARANANTSLSKLTAAGANKVISPYDIAAKRMAESILRPTVTDFIELTMGGSGKEIRMEEIPISAESRLASATLAGSRIRQELNLIVVAIKKHDGKMLFNPSFDATLEPGETVIVVGEWENLDKLEEILNPKA